MERRGPWLPSLPAGLLPGLCQAQEVLHRYVLGGQMDKLFANYLLPKSQVLLELPTIQDLSEPGLRGQSCGPSTTRCTEPTLPTGPSPGMAPHSDLASAQKPTNWL